MLTHTFSLFVPYVPSTRIRIKTILEMIKDLGIKKVADLGSGDGRILIALAEQGIEAHGFEINNFLIEKSRLEILAKGLEKKAFVHDKNYWKEDLGKYNFDLVTLYAMSTAMIGLERKLEIELSRGARIVSNFFQFPNREPVLARDNVYLYEL